MTVLRWTKKTPTQPGWYWLRDSDNRPWVCRVSRDTFERPLVLDTAFGRLPISALSYEWSDRPIAQPAGSVPRKRNK